MRNANSVPLLAVEGLPGHRRVVDPDRGEQRGDTRDRALTLAIGAPRDDDGHFPGPRGTQHVDIDGQTVAQGDGDIRAYLEVWEGVPEDSEPLMAMLRARSPTSRRARSCASLSKPDCLRAWAPDRSMTPTRRFVRGWRCRCWSGWSPDDDSSGYPSWRTRMSRHWSGSRHRPFRAS